MNGVLFVTDSTARPINCDEEAKIGLGLLTGCFKKVKRWLAFNRLMFNLFISPGIFPCKSLTQMLGATHSFIVVKRLITSKV